MRSTVLAIALLPFFGAPASSGWLTDGFNGVGGPVNTIAPIIPGFALFYLENKGTIVLHVQMLDSGRTVCRNIVIQPAEVQTLYLCGPESHLYWDDSVRTREVSISGGRAYQLYWDGTGWALLDVTEQRLDSAR